MNQITEHADFEQMLLHHTEMVNAVAYNLTHDVVAAGRLTEETLLRAWRSRDQFGEGAPLKSWLLTTLRQIFTERRVAKKVRACSACAAV
jgi:RNA polymerase sigma-70 factor (ECF subfamily)